MNTLRMRNNRLSVCCQIKRTSTQKALNQVLSFINIEIKQDVEQEDMEKILNFKFYKKCTLKFKRSISN